MLTLNRNIRKSFGSSSECLWNVMQKWQADLWHSSISRKENEPAANIIWLLVHHYVILAATISLFSFPLIPPGVRHFTMEPNRRSISFSLHFSYRFLTFGIHFKGRKIICWVAWRHPSFVINKVTPLAGRSLINDFSCLCDTPWPPVLPFSGRTRKRCTMYQVSRLVGPMWNSLTFPRIMTNRRVEKCAG